MTHNNRLKQAAREGPVADGETAHARRSLAGALCDLDSVTTLECGQPSD